MDKTEYINKAYFEADKIKIEYLKDSKSGRIKKGQTGYVSKENANYLIRYRIAKII